MTIDGIFSADSRKTRKGFRGGMVLAFTLCVLALMSLMGIAILSSTKTELRLTGNTRLNRQAFNTADNAARIAAFLTLALLNPRTDDIREIINKPPSPGPREPVEIELSSKFSPEALIGNPATPDFDERYLAAGAGEGTGDPHLVFKMNGNTVATAVVSLETSDLTPDGMTLSTGDPNDSGGGPKLRVGLVVTVRGRSTDLSDALPAGSDPSSVVTLLYTYYL
ncbi:MAG: pilus assembly PilX N-terminal domain-containing protein [Deltaproteobacteria bacterium]|jgi:hypothetical protein|nr:pilus assembly PilX N-terminal domain-containing protein [Deltaproteobacteria bacterium]